jgi:hypothetical protein
VRHRRQGIVDRTYADFADSLPPSWRAVRKEIVAEWHAADAKIDAQLKRRARRGDSSKAIAA